MKNKYFIDTEFIEGCQAKRFCGIPYGKTKPTIDLISIGIVNEEGKEYCAISKDFNLKEAWNRWQINGYEKRDAGMTRVPIREYWIRDNVLMPVWIYLTQCKDALHTPDINKFAYKSLKKLIKKYGKSNDEIAKEIKGAIYAPWTQPQELGGDGSFTPKDVEFYGYFADYDWVVFCWLFGLMIDLPKGFPYYCLDLKQMMYERGLDGEWKRTVCPDTEEEHDALADARWNLKLYNEIIKV